MTHEKYAENKSRKLVKIQGHMELWHSEADGPWLYDRNSKKWAKATLAA